MRNTCLTFMLAAVIVFFSSCKKDKLMVNEEKEFVQVGHKPTNSYDGGWQLTLRPDGIADVLPGGDIVFRGTYKINGSRIKVKTEQNQAAYTFDILSETDIKEKEFGTVLRLNGN